MTRIVAAGLLLGMLGLSGAVHAAGPIKMETREETKRTMGQSTTGDDHPGAALFAQSCAACHETGSTTRAPHVSQLRMLSYEAVLGSQETGVMKAQSAHLTSAQHREIADYLTGGPMVVDPKLPARCTGDAARFDYDQPPFTSGWGITRDNKRFIPGDVARLSKADLKNLTLKWSFAYPGANRARSQPSFAGGALMVGSQNGTVYAFDAASGCLRWTFRAGAEVRTGITIPGWKPGETPARPLGYFTDLMARVYAVDLVTGKQVWVARVDDHPNAVGTAQPSYHDGTVFQPVSSLEVVPASEPTYECCTFRGSVVALDAATGQQKWKTYTIEEELVKTGVNSAGATNWGPSGAPIWNSPTIDPRRNRIYAGTGENYSSPAQGSSDAIMAFDMTTGEIAWIRQTVSGDAWNVACQPNIPDKANCPKEKGPDVDFAAPPMLVSDGARDILVAGQKNGAAYGIDPDTGALIWTNQVGRGGNQGGIHFGLAADGTTVFVPMSDWDDSMLDPNEARPGLNAVDAFTGKKAWYTPADDVCGGREFCAPGIAAAITAIPDMVVAGHRDGRLRIYDAATGAVLWEYNTDRTFKTPTGAVAEGGSMGGGSGPMVVDGHIYVNSGYGIYYGMPGNALLVFGPK
ncbi:PQQ-binding-like beta-propeller repeat protein [Emcibacter sp. SYSU 3D8]|uniref:outer membrane protein assembly factor BamB family protein n=1 Tax=Emcibacter sp. SYSU 3D8 TaxID=3133969 RepID=UPI0031FEF598